VTVSKRASETRLLFEKGVGALEQERRSVGVIGAETVVGKQVLGTRIQEQLSALVRLGEIERLG
jgi:hypothetical protein